MLCWKIYGKNDIKGAPSKFDIIVNRSYNIYYVRTRYIASSLFIFNYDVGGYSIEK